MSTNIRMIYSEGNDVYVYSHWGGPEFKERVRKALNRHTRWDDESYLAAIIIREVFRDEIETDTGFGVSPYSEEEDHQTTVVDFAAKTVNGVSFQEFLDERPI